jgi:hypothetical protein
VDRISGGRARGLQFVDLRQSDRRHRDGAAEGPGSSSSSRANGGVQAGYDKMTPSRLLVGGQVGVSFFAPDNVTTFTNGRNTQMQLSVNYRF